jgi:hypothetical protein
MTSDPDLSDLADILAFFPETDSAHRYGWCYQVELTDETLHTVTYARSLAPVPYFKSYQYSKDPDAVDVLHPPTSPRPFKKRGGSQALSPYDFRPSIEIPLEWTNVATIDQTTIQNATWSESVSRQDLLSVGSTGVFNPKLVRIKPDVKLALPVVSPTRELPIDKDPFIAKFAETPSAFQLRVFASARTLAAVVASSRSLQPFHLIFDKRGTDLYVLSRDDESDPATVETNLETITTTTLTVPRDKMQLEFRENTIESTAVNAAFAAFGRDLKEDISLGEPAEAAAVYRQIVIREIEFIIRCPVDAVQAPPVQTERALYVIARTFNDVPTSLRRTNWEKDLTQKRGEILSAEIGANAGKVARWLVIAQLLEAETCMIGYTVRRHPSSRAAHVLLGIEKQSPASLGKIISLFPKRTYGVLHLVFSRMIGVSEGRYAYVRDSKTKVKKTYSIFAMVGKDIDELPQVTDDDAAVAVE